MEIGAKLKEAREFKNLSLEDIQKITKIQTRYLQAIEKGNFNIMPGNFYVRAFIKEYAYAVDLDPDQLFEEHSNELPSTSDESSVNYTRVQRSRKDTTTSRNPAIFSFLPTIIVILLIVGILFMVWYFKQDASLFNDDEPSEQMEEDNNEPDQVKLPDNEEQRSNSSSEDEESNDGVEQTEELEENQDQESDQTEESSLELVEYQDEQSTYDFLNVDNEIKLELSSSDKNWLEIENGKGKSFYYEMLLKDNSPVEVDMTGEEQIHLKFGNPAAITISINGVPLELSDDITPTEVQNVWINVQNEA